MHTRTRRQFLRLAALSSGSALLWACTPTPPPAPTAAPTARVVATQAPPVVQAPIAAPAAAKPTEAPVAAAKPAEALKPTAPAAPIKTGGSLTYAVVRSPDSLDPTALASTPSRMVYSPFYDSLIARAPDNTFRPWLADSWEISPDGKAYTFKLRRDVKFHDGTPFNSQAVKFMMDRIHDPNAKSRLTGGAYGFYEATDTPDDYTAIIRMSRPWASFMDSISYVYRIISPTAAQKWGEDFGQHPVGTGPFVFQEWVPNSHVVMKRNPDYKWASPMFKVTGPAPLETLTYRIVPEASTRLAALERGDVQIIEELPPQELARIKADPKYKIEVGIVQGRSYCYTINMRKPPTNELPVRQAMNYAINQEAIVNIVFGPYQSLGAMSPARSTLLPTTWSYEKKASEVYSHDPARAKQLLEDAGWKPGPDGIRMKDGKRLEIILGTWEHGVAEVIQAQYREVGIDFQIKVAPTLTTNESARREEVHMGPVPNSRSDPELLSSVHSRNRGTAGTEFTFHSNAHLDELLDAGASATNNDERLKIYSEVQMIMMQDAMFLPVFSRDNVTAARAGLDGIVWDRGLFPMMQDVTLAT